MRLNILICVSDVYQQQLLAGILKRHFLAKPEGILASSALQVNFLLYFYSDYMQIYVICFSTLYWHSIYDHRIIERFGLERALKVI